jgi:ATP-dependent Zn protease
LSFNSVITINRHILTSYCCLYIATPLILSTAEFFTTKKETRRTASEGIPTSTFTTRIKAPGAAKELLTKNNAYFSTVTSSTAIFTTTRKGTPKATTKISKDNTYENGIIDSHSAHNQSSSIYLLIVLPVIAILILLLVVGIIFYWRRWVIR